MKKRAVFGIIVAVVFSALFAGTALAKTVDVTYPEGDLQTGKITEWEIMPDGRVHCSGVATAPNGYGAGILEVGNNGEPILTTFDNKKDFVAAQKARGWEPFEVTTAFPDESEGRLETPSRSGDGHIGITGVIRNPSSVAINWSNFITDYSFSDTQITYYAKHPYSYSLADNGWVILSGPNYTPPYYIPTSTSALGTYNTSFAAPGGAYNWLSLRNRAYPNDGAGYGVSGHSITLESGAYTFSPSNQSRASLAR